MHNSKTTKTNKATSKTLASLILSALLVTGILSALPAQAITTPNCYIPAAQDRTVVNLGSWLYADRGASAYQGQTVSTSIPGGTYKITFMSFDGHAAKASTQSKEQWYLAFSNGQTTAQISDLPEIQDTLIEVVNNTLTINDDITSVTPIHPHYPTSSAQSVFAVCAAFDKVVAPSPTPTPEATPAPTPTPEPEDDDNDNDEDENNDSGDASLSIEITDNRDITRPTHELTYEVNFKNTGEQKLDEVEVKVTIPSKVTITGVSDGGNIEGNRVEWGKFGLGDGETDQFYIKGKVKDDTSNGHALSATAKVRDDEEGVSANDTDTTVIERQGVVAAATTVITGAPTPPVLAAIAPEPVPVTAATGATSALALVTTLLGSTGIVISKRITK